MVHPNVCRRSCPCHRGRLRLAFTLRHNVSFPDIISVARSNLLQASDHKWNNLHHLRPSLCSYPRTSKLLGLDISRHALRNPRHRRNLQRQQHLHHNQHAQSTARARGRFHQFASISGYLVFPRFRGFGGHADGGSGAERKLQGCILVSDGVSEYWFGDYGIGSENREGEQ